jgi:hypothetical protein
MKLVRIKLNRRIGTSAAISLVNSDRETGLAKDGKMGLDSISEMAKDRVIIEPADVRAIIQALDPAAIKEECSLVPTFDSRTNRPIA